jgi:hypothetical protein
MAMGCISDEQAVVYGRFEGAPLRVELERFFFIDDFDQHLVGRRRGEQEPAGVRPAAVGIPAITGTRTLLWRSGGLDEPVKGDDFVAQRDGEFNRSSRGRVLGVLLLKQRGV